MVIVLIILYIIIALLVSKLLILIDFLKTPIEEFDDEYFFLGIISVFWIACVPVFAILCLIISVGRLGTLEWSRILNFRK